MYAKARFRRWQRGGNPCHAYLLSFAVREVSLEKWEAEGRHPAASSINRQGMSKSGPLSWLTYVVLKSFDYSLLLTLITWEGFVIELGIVLWYST